MITSAAGVCIDNVFLSAVNAAVLFSGGGRGVFGGNQSLSAGSRHTTGIRCTGFWLLKPWTNENLNCSMATLFLMATIDNPHISDSCNFAVYLPHYGAGCN